MTSTYLPQIGDRIEYEDYRGTIRYIGNVPRENTDGPIFIGVEWDDISRGKHNGTFKQQVYFKTQHPTSGSFLKSTLPNIIYGCGFIQALKEKYFMVEQQVCDTFIGFGGNEKISVETVGWNKVYQKQKNIDQLREVGLAGKGIKFADGDVYQVCPNIVDLDLSRNLFRSFESVADIIQGLPRLTSLRLNDVRLYFPIDSGFHQLFQTVTHLSLSFTKMSWENLMSIEPFFPNLQELNFGFNNLVHIEKMDAKVQFQKLKVLNLENNLLESWNDVHMLGNLASLQDLHLNNNVLHTIQYFKSTETSDYDSSERKSQPLSEVPFRHLNSINLIGNQVQDWLSVHQLNHFPSLVDVRFKENPILNSIVEENRHLILRGRLGKVTRMNKSKVDDKRRMDAEIYYLTQIIQSKDRLKNNLEQQHPRFRELEEKYRDFVLTEKKVQSIKDEVLILNLQYQDKVIEKRMLGKVTVRALKSMMINLFKLGAKVSNASSSIVLTARYSDGRLHELDDDIKEIQFYSLESSDYIILNIVQK